MAGRRRQRLVLERIATAVGSVFPHTVGGRVPGQPVLTTGRAAALGRNSSGSAVVKGRRHFAAVIKAEGEAPAGVYTLAHTPADQPNWPRVFAGAALQTEGVDWSIAGRTLNILTGMDLRAGEELFVAYDYLSAFPSAPGEAGSFVGAATSTVPNPVVPVPDGVVAGDLLILSRLSDGVTTINSPAFTEYATVSGLKVWTRVADGSETDVNITDDGGTFGRLAYTLTVWRGTSILDDATFTTSATNPIAAPSIAGCVAGETVVVVASLTSGTVDATGIFFAGLTSRAQAEATKKIVGVGSAVLAASGASPSWEISGDGTINTWAVLALRLG